MCVKEESISMIDPPLQVPQPENKESIKDALHGLLNNASLKKTVGMNTRQGNIWKDVLKQAQRNQQ